MKKILIFSGIIFTLFLVVILNCQQASSGSGGGGNSNVGVPSEWLSQLKITASVVAHDNFGSSVSISGNYVIIGASNEDGTGTDRGTAYIFHRDEITGDWDAGIKIIATNPEDNAHFGDAVSISGDYTVVGAKYDGGTNIGAAYIITR